MTGVADSRFCSVCARQAGLDPGGSGGGIFDTVLAVEMPLPWPATLYGDTQRMPPEILALMEHIRSEYQRTRELRILTQMIAPDADYSVPGYRRVIGWQRPDGPFARFQQSEYLVPDDQIGSLAYALALAPERLGDFAAFRQPADDVRDLLVCTHGTVDAACSKFGYPAYRQLRRIAAESGETLRVWRTTHFGGHVFAPTLMDMPHGSYWAYIGVEEAQLLAHESGDPARLYAHYRGWAGLPAPFLQVLERELFVRHGWSWRDYAKTGQILSQDQRSPSPADEPGEPAWVEVRIDYASPDGRDSGAYRARVELSQRIEIIHTSGQDALYAYPQYSVAGLEHIADDPQDQLHVGRSICATGNML